jgi:hypothetical protein
MREEPVVYINGLPFVLREQRRPLKNLQVRMVVPPASELGVAAVAMACAGWG